MAGPYFNVIRFVSDNNGPVVRLSLEGEFVLGIGVRIADKLNTAILPASEYDLFKNEPARTGTLQFWFNSAPAIGRPPDYQIKKVSIVDVEPMEYGIADAKGTRRIMKYRLFLADRRHAFVSPRGGNLRVGKINFEGDKKQYDNHDLIVMCLTLMGLSKNDYVIKLDVPLLPKMKNLEWRGNHAPSELEKILDQLHCVFALQSDGTFLIEPLGKGTEPNVPLAQQLPEAPQIPNLDRRGKTVVFSSQPNAIIDTVTLKKPGDGFEFVAQDELGNWVEVNQLAGILGGKSPSETVRTKFKSVSEGFREKMQAELYHFIRILPLKFPFGILRLLNTAPGVERIITVSAKVAVFDKERGLWVNSTSLVECQVTHILTFRNKIGEDPFTMLVVAQRLGKLVDSPGTQDPEKDFIPLEDGDIQITISYERFDTLADGTKVPLYYDVGFTRELNNLKQLSESDLRNALIDPETVVISKPEWVLYQDNGDSKNRKDLEAEAKGLAERYLKNSGSPVREVHAVGFCQVELGGLVNEIRITQREPRTVCKINNWCLPRFGMSLEEWRHRLEDGGRYPQATSVAGDRTARGLDGNTQPSVPVMPGPAIAPAVGSLPVGKEQFTQWTTVIPNFADWDFDRATP
jgi:hypothetical protein